MEMSDASLASLNMSTSNNQQASKQNLVQRKINSQLSQKQFAKQQNAAYNKLITIQNVQKSEHPQPDVDTQKKIRKAIEFESVINLDYMNQLNNSTLSNAHEIAEPTIPVPNRIHQSQIEGSQAVAEAGKQSNARGSKGSSPSRKTPSSKLPEGPEEARSKSKLNLVAQHRSEIPFNN